MAALCTQLVQHSRVVLSDWYKARPIWSSLSVFGYSRCSFCEIVKTVTLAPSLPQKMTKWKDTFGGPASCFFSERDCDELRSVFLSNLSWQKVENVCATLPCLCNAALQRRAPNSENGFFSPKKLQPSPRISKYCHCDALPMECRDLVSAISHPLSKEERGLPVNRFTFHFHLSGTDPCPERVSRPALLPASPQKRPWSL